MEHVGTVIRERERRQYHLKVHVGAEEGIYVEWWGVPTPAPLCGDEQQIEAYLTPREGYELALILSRAVARLYELRAT